MNDQCPVVDSGTSALTPEAECLSFAPQENQVETSLDLQAQLAKVGDGAGTVSSSDLATLLEGFAGILRGQIVKPDFTSADQGAEIEQLKELLMEAQETIIELLNDRVQDRAKIARLEAEVKLLPDMQSQANRAMGLAIRSEDVQNELVHVKAEIERLRSSYMRRDHGFFARLFGKDKIL